VKPAPFEYFAPWGLEEALDILAERTEDAAVLAGGQSLVPAMNFRLATPSVLVDINRIPGLDRVRVEGDEFIIEPLVRHANLETPVTPDPLGVLLSDISHLVGHLPIRVRGTFVGSIAHADPAAEWCALAVALDASILVRHASGERAIAARDFFEGPYTTALRPGEMVAEVRLPLLGAAGAGFVEKSRTAGDFAIVAVVATLRTDEGSIAEARIAIGGAEGRPVRAARAEELLLGADTGPDLWAAVAAAAAEDVDPIGDAFCSADYRRHLVEVLTDRALVAASERAA
jgi:carbon-monoxide dehydrogenase medium subunit